MTPCYLHQTPFIKGTYKYKSVIPYLHSLWWYVFCVAKATGRGRNRCNAYWAISSTNTNQMSASVPSLGYMDARLDIFLTTRRWRFYWISIARKSLLSNGSQVQLMPSPIMWRHSYEQQWFSNMHDILQIMGRVMFGLVLYWLGCNKRWIHVI